VHLKLAGAGTNLNMGKIEKKWWLEDIPEASGGNITTSYVSIFELGLKGDEQLRLAKLGVLEFFDGNFNPISKEDPIFRGIDMFGMAPTHAEARKMADAYLPVLSRIAEEKFGIKILMVWPNPAQTMYCKDKGTGLADFLTDKKVRAGQGAVAAFVEKAGGTPVSIPWTDVIPSAQSGLINCGITGTLSGNTAKWPEVFNYLFPMKLYWGFWFSGVSLAAWDRLAPAVQTFLETEMAKHAEIRWQVSGEETQDGINCNVGQGECNYGVASNMTLVPVEDEDIVLLNQWAKEIAPMWVKQVGDDAAKEWNATAGKALGVELPIGN
jgi:TRAP-type C4-dicarboxylate transport system substrate-binding protein